MLLNISYRDPKQKKQIDDSVGKPFSLQKRWKLGGIGSQKLIINSASVDIYNLLILDHNINSCNIELRPNGIIVRFRSLLETYGLIIPYYKLKIYKGKAQEYSIYKDHYFIKIIADSDATHQFFNKINGQKIENLPPSFEDL
ncbi:hypothetical protein N9I15_04855 [Flavobacteriaceae bacterium]|jgi:hypothetical protein|nr:hypothetical protein [Flavobacteriaceae bacterium]MDA8644522.1 hypothetical protein [Flavobacteriaceae bacterium]MDA8877948.1 hypothetical protein [Flavobacteriaceae bacterium]MDC0386742.1 hypothetical protein [Flavobacteriaceae bacterium]MDC0871812.1 hypothetical protein [Flavobacteriaceae bacterium]